MEMRPPPMTEQEREGSEVFVGVMNFTNTKAMEHWSNWGRGRGYILLLLLLSSAGGAGEALGTWQRWDGMPQVVMWNWEGRCGGGAEYGALVFFQPSYCEASGIVDDFC